MPAPTTEKLSEAVRSIGQTLERIRACASDRNGAAAVEFAIVVVPFVMFLFLILQIGLYFFSQQALDYATRTAARQVLIGNVQAQGLTAAQFKTNLLCPALEMPLPCNSITVSLSEISKTSDPNADTGIYAFMLQNVPSLNPANLDTSKGTFCSGSPGDYIFIDVAFSFPLVFDMAKLVGGSSGANPLILRSTAFVANEPYQSSGTGSAC